MLKAKDKIKNIISLGIFFGLFFISVCESKENIKYYQLDNGIGLIIKEDNRNKVVAVETWIKGGSVKENKKNYGITHFIEHMLFKGTKERNAAQINDLVKSKGGYFNAATSYDYTKYYIVLPSRYINTALDIESDILKNSLLEKEEIDKEKGVIQEERKRQLDNPEAYIWLEYMKDNPNNYPYKNPIIGYKNTIKNIDRNKIIEYKKNEYVGNNIFIVIIGDVKSEKAYETVKTYFSDISKKDIEGTLEYNNKKAKRFEYKKLKNKQQKTYLLMGYKIPNLKEKDIYALDLLAEIIGGGYSSRLYQRVISEDVAADYVDASIFTGKYPGYLLISARLEQNKLKQCIQDIYGEIKKIQQNSINENELSIALSKLEIDHIKSQEDYSEAADIIGYYNVIKDYKYAEEYINNLKKVTTYDINQAVKKYLMLENCKLFITYPPYLKESALPDEQYIKNLNNKLNYDEINSKEKPFKESKYNENISKREEFAGKVKAIPKIFNLYGGAKLIFYKDTSFPVVSVYAGRIGGFVNENSDNNGITNLAQKMLLKGNNFMSRKEIEFMLDSLGANLSPIFDKNKIGLSCYVLTRNFNKTMKIFFESIFEPAFFESEINKGKAQIINEINGKEDDMEYYAEEQATKLLYGENHPYALSLDGKEINIKRFNRNDLIKWQKSMYKLNGLVISVAGNIEEKELLNTINGYLHKANIDSKEISETDLYFTNNKTVTESIIKRERNQTTLVYSNTGPSFNSKDYYAFKLFNIVMNGLGGRIFQKLREEEGLVYDAYSYLDQALGVGTFQIVVSCDPLNEKKVKEKIINIFNEVKTKGITFDEYNKTKQYYEGILLISMQTNWDKARAYMNNELLGRGYKNVDLLPEKIKKITKKQIEEAGKKNINFDRGVWFIVRSDVSK